MQRYHHIFGPVPSRRFGRSLGVDLTPLKTCTLDCIFCQLGHTSRKTLERADYIPVEEVKSELARWHKDGGKADYVTLSGSGEPTLHSRFGEVLNFIKKELPFPAVLLSNGTLFWLPEVREAALAADVVKLSLSAWDQPSFRKINRPHASLDFDRCVEGLRTFRGMFHGKIWLEVFLLQGINAREDEVEKIARLAETLAPDEIHLNTAVRPPAEASATPVDQECMERLTALFRPQATVIAGFPTRCGANIKANERSILDMLLRRPCTTQQIAAAFDMHLNEVSKYLGDLTKAHLVQSEYRNGDVYFNATHQRDAEPTNTGAS